MGRRGGFSLLEAILAITTLAVVLILVFNLFPTSLWAMRKAEHRMQADTMARTLLNEYRAMPFSRLTELTLEPPQALPPQRGAGEVDFYPVIEVRRVGDTPPERLVELRVTIDWSSRGQGQIVQSLYVSKLDP